MPRSGPHRYGAYERAHKDETAERMAARRFMEKKLGRDIGPGIDVDHRKSIKAGGSNDPKNLRLRKAGPNRGDKTFYD